MPTTPPSLCALPVVARDQGSTARSRGPGCLPAPGLWSRGPTGQEQGPGAPELGPRGPPLSSTPGPLGSPAQLEGKFAGVLCPQDFLLGRLLPCRRLGDCGGHRLGPSPRTRRDLHVKWAEPPSAQSLSIPGVFLTCWGWKIVPGSPHTVPLKGILDSKKGAGSGNNAALCKECFLVRKRVGHKDPGSWAPSLVPFAPLPPGVGGGGCSGKDPHHQLICILSLSSIPRMWQWIGPLALVYLVFGFFEFCKKSLSRTRRWRIFVSLPSK